MCCNFICGFRKISNFSFDKWRCCNLVFSKIIRMIGAKRSETGLYYTENAHIDPVLFINKYVPKFWDCCKMIRTKEVPSCKLLMNWGFKVTELCPLEIYVNLCLLYSWWAFRELNIWIVETLQMDLIQEKEYICCVFQFLWCVFHLNSCT